MNTDPTAVKILCYGDSNTWGQKPDKSGRYPSDIRWPGVVQRILGSQYYVIEEGLGSRTTNLEYSRKPGRNGLTYLEPCLESHTPLDYVVIMLGTNDLKIQYGRSSSEVAAAISILIDTIRARAKTSDERASEILLVSPILINDKAEDFSSLYDGIYNETSASESRNLKTDFEVLAHQKNCHYLDASRFASAGSDGIHFSQESHPALGKAIANKLIQIMGE